MRKRLGAAIVAAALGCGAAQATTYSTIYSFGDSLSDAGNVFAATGGAIPAPSFLSGVPAYFNRKRQGLDSGTIGSSGKRQPADLLHAGNVRLEHFRDRGPLGATPVCGLKALRVLIDRMSSGAPWSTA